MIPVILSGGVGSRLWPLSRGMYPKQLLKLADPDLTMLQQTIVRGMSVATKGEQLRPIVVCNEQHRFMVAEQLRELQQQGTILLEPQGKNTAPAIAIAAFNAIEVEHGDALLLVMPADHLVADQAAFAKSVDRATELANNGKLVTFGITPKHAETGYGYIKAGAELGPGFAVAGFKEKPTAQLASSFIEEGGYYWNGGIFLFKASVYLAELERHQPAVFEATQAAAAGAKVDLDFIRVDEASFSTSPSISIDYAVMEQTDQAAVVELDAGWNDIGSWEALWNAQSKDSNGNAIQGDVLAIDTHGSHILAESKLVATVGVEELVIVQTEDAILVADRSRSQDVKFVVDSLKSEARTHTDHHRKVYRPWGWYDSIDSGDRFQVKRIQVNPGAKLSVQMHNHRAEHWVVVKGVAEVLNGEQMLTLSENQSTYIPIGVTHALRNPSTTEPLEIIEVQSGTYLGEDDIVRFEDEYGRAGTSD